MSKFIFILFLFLCTKNSFGQESTLSADTENELCISAKPDNTIDKKVVFNESDIDLLLNNNLCEILSIKPSDLLNEKLLKKFKGNA